MKQYLKLFTERSDLRSSVNGWGNIEDPRLYQAGRHIGLTSSLVSRRYESVLQALSDGWELLGPPVEQLENTAPITTIDSLENTGTVFYEWWLVKSI